MLVDFLTVVGIALGFLFVLSVVHRFLEHRRHVREFLDRISWHSR